jgi:class 3 adenylate cyclase
MCVALMVFVVGLSTALFSSRFSLRTEARILKAVQAFVLLMMGVALCCSNGRRWPRLIYKDERVLFGSGIILYFAVVGGSLPAASLVARSVTFVIVFLLYVVIFSAVFATGPDGALADSGQTVDSLLYLGGLVGCIIITLRLTNWLERADRSVTSVRTHLLQQETRLRSLLLSMLPNNAVDALMASEHNAVVDGDDRDSGRDQPDATVLCSETFESVSILFVYICDVKVSKSAAVPGYMSKLNELYGMLDKLTDAHKCYKVENIATCYMVAAGVPTRRTDHASALALLALDVLHTVSASPSSPLVRLGIASGAVHAGVVGFIKPKYTLTGDTVNTASRVASTAKSMECSVCPRTAELLADTASVVVRPRGTFALKGKGQVDIFGISAATNRLSIDVGLLDVDPTRVNVGESDELWTPSFESLLGSSEAVESSISADRASLSLSRWTVTFRKPEEEASVDGFCSEEHMGWARTCFVCFVAINLYLAAVTNQFSGADQPQLIPLIIHLGMTLVVCLVGLFIRSRFAVVISHASAAEPDSTSHERLRPAKTDSEAVSPPNMFRVEREIRWATQALFFVWMVKICVVLALSPPTIDSALLLMEFATVAILFAQAPSFRFLFFASVGVAALALLNVINAALLKPSTVPSYVQHLQRETLVALTGTAAVALAVRYATSKTTRVSYAMRYKVGRQSERTERLLSRILPPRIAARVRRAEPLPMEQFEGLVFVCTDLKGFTAMSTRMSPSRLVSFINMVYTSFDRLLLRHSLFKLEVIGDAYLAVSGMTDEESKRDGGRTCHKTTSTGVRVQRAVALAFDMHSALARVIATVPEAHDVSLRVGIHLGDAYGGVIGSLRFRYHLFGQSLAVAEALEAACTPKRVLVSEQVAAHLLPGRYETDPLGSPVTVDGAPIAACHIGRTTVSTRSRTSKRHSSRRRSSSRRQHSDRQTR